MQWLAWIDEHDEAFDPAVHCREDLVVLSLRLSESVGIAPIFEVEIPNPGVAGLITQSKRYAILSEQLESDPVPVELARGVVTSVPSELATTTVRLEFRCQPPDADEVHKAAADALRVGEVPYNPNGTPASREDAEAYDPVFVGQDGDDDPSTALEGRYEEWIWDRRTLTVGRTNILSGRRTVDIGSSALEGSPSMIQLDPPSKTMRLRVRAGWTQVANGVQSWPVGITPQYVSTYTHEDFVSQFPRPGTPIGADTGWSLAEAKLIPLGPAEIPFVREAVVEGKYPAGTVLRFRAQKYEMKLRAAYDYQQAREELLTLSLPLAVHDVLRDDRTETVDTIELNNLTIDVVTDDWMYEDPETLEVVHYVVGDERKANGRTWLCMTEHDATERFQAVVTAGSSTIYLWAQIPKKAAIEDARTPEYFSTPRGIRSVRHAIRRLARKSVLRARCFELTFELAWSVARDLTLDDSIRLEYREFPGGEVTGKLVGIELNATENGTRIARLTVGVSHGLGTAAPSPGHGQSTTADGVVYAVSAPPPVIPVNAYGLSTEPPTIFDVHNKSTMQEAAMLGGPDPAALLAAAPTTVSLGYPVLREEDLLPRRLTVQCEALPIPTGINLTPVEP